MYGSECTYDTEPETRRVKPSRKSVSSVLTRPNPHADLIVNSLRTLPENEAISLLRTVRTQDNLEETAELLSRRASSSHDSTVSPLETEPPNSSRSSVSGPTADLGLTAGYNSAGAAFGDRRWSETIASGGPQTDQDSHLLSWFRTPQDARVVNHLLDIYFNLHHPFHTVFSGPHFRYDLRNGRSKYCCPALVHAVLSLACNYVDRYSQPGGYLNTTAMGNEYFAEAMSIVNASPEPCLMHVQALTVMGLREGSCGHETGAYSLIGRAVRMALGLGLHLEITPGSDTGLTQLDVEIRKITFWGTYIMET